MILSEPGRKKNGLIFIFLDNTNEKVERRSLIRRNLTEISDLRDTHIVSACRTAIGEFGGGFKDVRADDLSVAVAQEAVKRAGIEKSQVEDIIWGRVTSSLTSVIPSGLWR